MDKWHDETWAFHLFIKILLQFWTCFVATAVCKNQYKPARNRYVALGQAGLKGIVSGMRLTFAHQTSSASVYLWRIFIKKYRNVCGDVSRLSYLADDTIINSKRRRHIWRRGLRNERDAARPEHFLSCARVWILFLLSEQPIIVLSLRKTTRNNRLVIAIAEFETRDRPESVSSSSSFDL